MKAAAKGPIMQIESSRTGERGPIDEFLEPTRLLGLALILLTTKLVRHLHRRWAAGRRRRLRAFATHRTMLIEERASE